MPEAAGQTPGPDSPARPARLTALVRRHRLAAAILLLVASVAGLRLWWGWKVGRELAAQREAIRVRGEPLTVAELSNVQVLPDYENAWVLVAQAQRLDSATAPGNTNDDYPRYPPFGR